MQFPVPQFTDVEDKIIGPLTIKQFGIIFGAGALVFLSFQLTKSLLVGAFFMVLFGLPALGVAFAKINGRPIYNSFGHFFAFVTSPKLLVFHKEVSEKGASVTIKDAEIPSQITNRAVEGEDRKEKLKEINQLLQKQAEEERALLKANK